MKFENKTGRGDSLMEQCLKEERIKSDVTLNVRKEENYVEDWMESERNEADEERRKENREKDYRGKRQGIAQLKRVRQNK